MKKLIAAGLALCLAAGAATAAFAEDTTVTESNNNTETSPAPTKITLTADEYYTVTIPQEATVDTKNQNGTYTGTLKITCTEAFLKYGEAIKVNLTSTTHSYNLQADYDEEVLLPYKVTNSSGTSMSSKNTLAAEFTESGEETLTITTTFAPTYAGNYSDTMNFTVSVGTAATDTD